MRFRILFLLPIICASQVSIAATNNVSKGTELHCTGQTWVTIDGVEKSETEAFVRVTDDSVFIEVYGVGTGNMSRVRKSDRSSIVDAGGLIFSYVDKKHASENTIYNLNRFTGNLTIIGSEKWIFSGSCSKANPLFF